MTVPPGRLPSRPVLPGRAAAAMITVSGQNPRCAGGFVPEAAIFRP
jgi:hypothetical protein